LFHARALSEHCSVRFLTIRQKLSSTVARGAQAPDDSGPFISIDCRVDRRELDRLATADRRPRTEAVGRVLSGYRLPSEGQAAQKTRICDQRKGAVAQAWIGRRRL